MASVSLLSHLSPVAGVAGGQDSEPAGLWPHLMGVAYSYKKGHLSRCSLFSLSLIEQSTDLIGQHVALFGLIHILSGFG